MNMDKTYELSLSYELKYAINIYTIRAVNI